MRTRSIRLWIALGLLLSITGAWAQSANSTNANQSVAELRKMAELVFDSLIPGEGEAESRFASLVDNEVRMSEVFEKFVRNFYIAEQQVFKVRAEQVEWHATLTIPVMDSSSGECGRIWNQDHQLAIVQLAQEQRRLRTPMVAFPMDVPHPTQPSKGLKCPPSFTPSLFCHQPQTRTVP